MNDIEADNPALAIAIFSGGQDCRRADVRAKMINYLPRGHVDTAEEGINLIAAIDIQHIFTGSGQVEMDPALIGGFNEQAGAKGAKIGIKAMHGIIEVGLVQNHLHTRGHFLEPCANALSPVIALEHKPEPWPHGACHAALHSRGKCAHGQHPAGVEQAPVYARVAVGCGVRIRPEPCGQEQLGQSVPGLVPAAAFVFQGFIAPRKLIHIRRHDISPVLTCRFALMMPAPRAES